MRHIKEFCFFFDTNKKKKKKDQKLSKQTTFMKHSNVSIAYQNIRFRVLFWFAAKHFSFLDIQQAHESEANHV